MKVAIQRINLPSLGKMGCLLGAVAAFLPSLLCGLLGVGLGAGRGASLGSVQLGAAIRKPASGTTHLFQVIQPVGTAQSPGLGGRDGSRNRWQRI